MTSASMHERLDICSRPIVKNGYLPSKAHANLALRNRAKPCYCGNLTPIYTHRYWPDYLGRFAAFSGARFSLSQKIDEMGRWPRQSCAATHVHTQTKGDCNDQRAPLSSTTIKRASASSSRTTASKDVFVHATALERAGLRGLHEGQKVTFDTQEDRAAASSPSARSSSCDLSLHWGRRHSAGGLNARSTVMRIFIFKSGANRELSAKPAVRQLQQFRVRGPPPLASFATRGSPRRDREGHRRCQAISSSR